VASATAMKGVRAEAAGFRRRFRDESQAVAMLSHPNIVSVYDVSRGETEYIVMELIDGITLKQYMEKRGQLNWREALHFITQIMKALSHAHSRGIIHRRIEIIAADIDARHGVKTEVTIGRGYPCVVNDEILVKQATALAKAEKLKVEMLPLRTTAEDFGFYCKQYPSLFYRLGVGAAAGRPHTATFFPDEAAIGVGIAYMRKLALQLLEK